MKKILIVIIASLSLVSCKDLEPIDYANSTPFVWESANIYFLLTDRFNNADPTNDINFERTNEAAVLRGFEGGDLKGITQKIKEGHFTDLGINAIWMTPIVEQIHGGTDEGTGVTYGFHGYWASDWTAIDPNFGTKEDLKELVAEAHKRGIRIVLDAVINHTGPATEKDTVWPSDWVRTDPQCEYSNYENTITCTLVKNLPDIKTESNEAVELPPKLVEKWKLEGRYEQEVAELDAFFERTGYPRAPRFYIMKWLSDYITEFGIDGYRCDTVKHTEEFVWQEFKTVCDAAFDQFKKENPEKVLDENNFYLVGEIYNYTINGGKYFDFGDKKVNYFDDSFQSQINFDFKWDAARMPIEDMFAKYNSILQNELKGYGVLNYLSSHDDGSPFDPKREKSYETATKLLLSPGASQVYYGDEFTRELVIEGAVGDANLRSVMDWAHYGINEDRQLILAHWQKLGKFRRNHPSIGVGIHKMISESPYVFERTFANEKYKDNVVVGLTLPKGLKEISVGDNFEEGETLRDAYSGLFAKVKNGKVELDSDFEIVLLEKFYK